MTKRELKLLMELREADRIIRELWAMSQAYNVPDGNHWPYMRQIERQRMLHAQSQPA